MSLEEKQAELRLLRKQAELKRLREQAAQAQALPQVLPGEQMSPEHAQFAQEQSVPGQLSQFAEAARPDIPVVSELGKMAGAAVSGAISGEGYDAAREQAQAKEARAEEQHPIVSGAADLTGAMMTPGGIIAGSGQIGADKLLKTGDLKEAAKDTASGLALGTVLKGAGKIAGKALGKSKTLDKQNKKIDEFLDPTSAQRADPRYREKTDYLTDKILLQQKANKTKLTREELNALVVQDNKVAADRLGDLRKREIGLTRKELQKTLQLKSKTADEAMDSVGRADFKKAASNSLPQEYHKSKSLVEKATKAVETRRTKVDKLAKQLASAKAAAINLPEKITVKGKSVNNPKFVRSKLRVSELESRIAKEQEGIAEQARQIKLNSDKMSEIESGNVTLENLYTQKTNLKRKDFAGEAERDIRKMEDKFGGEPLKQAKSDYGTTAELQKMTQSSIGKFATEKGANPHVPLGKLNQAVKAVQTLLPKHRAALKISGIESTSKLLKNDKWNSALKNAFDRQGGKGLATAHMMLIRRDPKYRETYNEEQKKKLEEGGSEPLGVPKKDK